MCDLVLTQTTVSEGQRALASDSEANCPAPVGFAAGCVVTGAGFGSAAWIAAGRGAGAAAGAIVGAAAGAEAVWARQDFRNSCQVWPFVVPAALAAFHWSPHCFITLSPLVAAGAAATGAGAGAAIGAEAGAEACWARQPLRNSC